VFDVVGIDVLCFGVVFVVMVMYLFGDVIDGVVVLVIKFMIGYLLGVVGVVEGIFMIFVLYYCLVLLMINVDYFDFEVDFDVVVDKFC